MTIPQAAHLAHHNDIHGVVNNAAGKPGTTASIRYASALGNDANDGLSWGTAKLTILAAFDALPAAGGTIFLAGNDGFGVNVGGTVPNQGLWLIGPQDPLYGTPPAGWRQQKRLRLIGVGIGVHGGNAIGGPAVGINAGSGTDLAKPAIWIAGTNIPLRFENLDIRYPAVGIRMGINPDQTNRGLNTAGIYMDNIHVSLNQIAGNGPAIDLGYTFWWTLKNSVIGANAAEAINTDKRACILSKGAPGGSGGGLYVIDNCVFNQGNFRYYCGTQSWGFVVRDLTVEGNGVDPVPTSIHILEAQGYGTALIDMVEVADQGPGTGATVKVEQASGGADMSPDCVWAHRVNLGVEGPATVLTSTNTVYTKTLAGSRQVGTLSGRITGQHDAARRVFAPGAVKAANLAPQDVTTWAAKSGEGTVTVTTGKRAPDGSMNAAELSTGSGNSSKEIYRAAATFAAGDWLIGGVWLRAANAANGPWSALVGTAAASVVLDLTGSNAFTLGSPITGDGEWEWIAGAAKVLSTTGVGELILALKCMPTQPTEYYAPILLHIPTGTLSHSEALELTQNLQSWPDGAPVGHLSTLRGQKLIARGGLGVGNSAAATTLGSVTKKIEVFSETGASLGFIPVYSTIT
jgi:hypothetical protein